MSEERSYFEKNMEMWERWTGSYMDTMAKAMEKTMEQSAALKKQMDEAASAAVDAQLDATLTALKSLEGQIGALSGKIDELIAKED